MVVGTIVSSGKETEREDSGQFFRVAPTGFPDRSNMRCNEKESRDLIPDIKQNTHIFR